MSATINLVGPSTNPGAPLITPAAINTAVNAAFANVLSATLAELIATVPNSPAFVAALADALYHGVVSVSVQAFGAVGDGVTEDTNAFLAAAAYVTTAGGGQIFVPEGRYLVSKSTPLSSNTSVIGVGPGSRMIVATGFANPGPTFPPGGGGYNVFSNINWAATVITDKNISVENLFIDNSNNPLYGAFSCVEFRMTDNVTVSNCSFLYGGDAVRFRASNDGKILNCDARLQVDCPWDCFEGCNNMSVIGCFSHTNNVNQPLAFNSILTNSDTNMVMDGALIVGNTFIDDTGRPIQIEPLGNSSTNVVKNVTFANNILKNVSLVFRGSVQGITVTGNVFSEFTVGGSAILCYQLFGNGIPAGVVVAGNSFNGINTTTGFGVIRVESPGAVISGNYVDGMGPSDGPCIYTGTTVTGAIITGNSLSNGKVQALQQVGQSSALYLPNAVHFGTYDNAGSPVDMVVQQSDNNLIWSGTSSTGSQRIIATMIQRADAGAFSLYPPVALAASFANHLLVNGATTGNQPVVGAVGTDTNIALRLQGQGSYGALLGAFSGAGAPTTAIIGAGQAAVWKDTTGGSVKFYYNDANTLKSLTFS